MLSEAHERFGHLPWRELFAPAIKKASQGFQVPARLALFLSPDSLSRLPRKFERCSTGPTANLCKPAIRSRILCMPTRFSGSRQRARARYTKAVSPQR
jgi:hypothetical protein